MPTPVSAFFVPIDSGTITASSAIGSAPSANLLTEHPKDLWQTNGAVTGVWIKVDLGAATTLGCVALMFTNLRSGATWRVKGGPSEANVDGGSPEYDSGSMTFWAGSVQNVFKPHGFLDLNPGVSKRWWRIELADSGHPDGYLTAGRLVLATGFRPARNPSFGGGPAWVDPSVNRRTKGGSLITQEAQRYLSASFAYPYASEADARAGFLELQRLNGISSPLLFIDKVDDTVYRMARMIYGKFEELNPVIHRKAQLFETRITMTEMC